MAREKNPVKETVQDLYELTSLQESPSSIRYFYIEENKSKGIKEQTVVVRNGQSQAVQDVLIPLHEATGSVVSQMSPKLQEAMNAFAIRMVYSPHRPGNVETGPNYEQHGPKFRKQLDDGWTRVGEAINEAIKRVGYPRYFEDMKRDNSDCDEALAVKRDGVWRQGATAELLGEHDAQEENNFGYEVERVWDEQLRHDLQDTVRYELSRAENTSTPRVHGTSRRETAGGDRKR